MKPPPLEHEWEKGQRKLRTRASVMYEPQEHLSYLPGWSAPVKRVSQSSAPPLYINNQGLNRVTRCAATVVDSEDNSRLAHRKVFCELRRIPWEMHLGCLRLPTFQIQSIVSKCGGVRGGEADNRGWSRQK